MHGNNKSDEELAFAAEKDAWLVVMDEPGEVERCVASGVRRVLLRITPGIEAGGHEKIMTGHLGSKFGVLPEDAVDVIRRARDAGLEMLGLHVHLGSQVVDDAPARMLVEWLAGWCAELRAELEWTPRSSISAAGLGIRYTLDEQPPPDPEEYARTLAEHVAHTWSVQNLLNTQLIFEPGRSIVGRAGLYALRNWRRQAKRPDDMGRGRRRNVGQPAPSALRRALHGPVREPSRRGPRGAVRGLRQAL